MTKTNITIGRELIVAHYAEIRLAADITVSKYLGANKIDWWDNYNDREEVFSRTLSNVEKKGASYDPSRKFRPWVMTVAFTTLMDYLDEHVSYTVIDDFDEEGDPYIQVAAARECRADEDFEYRDMLENYYKFLETRSELEQNIMDLYSQGFSVNEIAERVGSTPGSVSVRVSNIKRWVKEHLAA